jgi:hypothetical protein
MIYGLRGDIFFTGSTSTLGELIRWGETEEGEENTLVNHVGEVVEEGFIVPPIVSDEEHQSLISYAKTIEALWHTEYTEWWDRHGHESTTIEVWRPVGQTFEEIDREVQYLHTMVGKRYGWWKLAAHLVDTKIFRGKRVLRRLLTVDSRPICSYLIGKAKCLGNMSFGQRPEECTPDSMHDHVRISPQWYFVGKETLNG